MIGATVTTDCREDYECLRCLAVVTSATRREVTGDGWAFWRLPYRGPVHHRWTNTPPGREVALCGECAGMMRTLHAIRMTRELRP